MPRVIKITIILIISIFVVGCSNMQNLVATANLSNDENTRYKNMLVVDQKSLPLASYEKLGNARGKSCKPSMRSIASVSEEEAKRSLRIQAARMGGNAIINITCNRKHGQKNECYTSVLCKGEVIRIKSQEVIDEIKQTQRAKEQNQTRKTSVEEYGVGWLSPKGVVVTNHHIVKDHKNISLGLPTGRKIDARVEGKDPVNDIAIIATKNNLSGYRSIPLADAMLSAGSKVYTLGFNASSDLKQKPQPVKGSINSTYGLNGDPRIYTISASLNKGYSGSPLLNKDNEVVGIVIPRNTAKNLFGSQKKLPQNKHYAVKIAYLRPMLNSYTNQATKNITEDTTKQQDKSKSEFGKSNSKPKKGIFTVIAK